MALPSLGPFSLPTSMRLPLAACTNTVRSSQHSWGRGTAQGSLANTQVGVLTSGGGIVWPSHTISSNTSPGWWEVGGAPATHCLRSDTRSGWSASRGTTPLHTWVGT